MGKTSPPPTVQTNLGGRIFASCVALGRNFGATFRNACPPPASSSAPSALRRESRAARRRGDRAKGYAEIPTQGNARREVPPPTSGLSGCCLVTANILQTCFHHVAANLYGQYLSIDFFGPPPFPQIQSWNEILSWHQISLELVLKHFQHWIWGRGGQDVYT